MHPPLNKRAKPRATVMLFEIEPNFSFPWFLPHTVGVKMVYPQIRRGALQHEAYGDVSPQKGESP